MLNLNKELNELASSWYSLSELSKSVLSKQEAEEVREKQQQAGQQLIPMLQEMQASKDTPYETYLEGDTFVDIYLDENGEIRDNGHYSRPAL
ncbi:hypothetical protein D3C87_273900 [compost metagenome]|uniref:hypothetical protein n=1 Tax=Pedobacter sp. ok626 TaxID=1761882 RepID=UPI0008835634|nr:hypothetical protein [Pedobacter sp. ok626]SDJ59328.1 hypothetical protein SAMN04487898_103345 [Pedobacter sp. ok626]